MRKYKRTLLDEIKYYLYYAPKNYLDMFPKRVYWFFQRGFRGYGDNDTWDFDNYLCDVITSGLRELKKYQTGVPTEIYIKYDDTHAQEEWHKILDKIIEGFDCAKLLINDYCELEHEERMRAEIIRNEGFDLFKEYFMNLWD